MAKASRPPAATASRPPAIDVAAFDQAFADGDFARARSLAAVLASAAGPDAARLGVRRAALWLDPYVVYVGLGTAAVYAAAWAYALAQH